jgi:hypothetical protein
MKKIFTLVIALGAMTAVFAQRGYDHREESRDVILGQPNRGGVYNNDRGYNNSRYDIRERDRQIQRIRREYDWRIESVRHDRYLRKAERKRQVRFLENERDAKIRQVMQSYDNRNYRGYGNRRDRDDDRDYRRNDSRY